MRIIKLDAIDSTNDFLKGLSAKQELENYTVITAENQTKGKGQMGSVWTSEVSKNIIMSVLIKDFLTDTSQIYNLNIAVALAVVQALENVQIPNLRIKWPNDIMSAHKKIGGILIENSFKSDGTIFSIVGLGLNVNQTNFDKLPKASSLSVLMKKDFERETLIVKVVEAIQGNISRLIQKEANQLWEMYTDKLFKKGIPMPFQDATGQNFMGIIQGVSLMGKLRLLLEDDSVGEFNIKEIQMLY